MSQSTVGRVLRRAGLSCWCDLEPAVPVVRYEHENSGDLGHIDTKKLGRIERLGHRITGSRRDTAGSTGWEFLFVAIDDHSRVSFIDLYPDERKPSAIQLLQNTVAYYRSFGGARAAHTHRQWLCLPLQRVQRGLRGSESEASRHPRLPTADERQG